MKLEKSIKKSAGVNASDRLAISFVPYILKKQFAVNPLREFGASSDENYAALLWIDICSFSKLCNRLMKDTLHGVEIITNILQDHYSSLLKIITEFGGQPLFFAGDGLMTAWPGDEATAEKSVALAVVCAHEILAKLNTVDDKNELLSLHAIVSVGNWQMTELEGVDKNRLFSFSGEVFDDITLASRNKAPGEILISHKALLCLDKDLKSVPVEFDTFILKEIPWQFSIPQLKELQLTAEAIEKLESFVPRTLTFPLNRERLKWIAEIRPVTIVFVKLPNNSSHSSENRARLLTTTSLVKELVSKYDGLLSQVWMDEKESNMLICFGPPPSAHNDNPERGVHLAFEINRLFLKSGFENNIGVSTGMAYCGIIGNDFLRQYTVIGDVVNVSERLAEIKENTVLCDRTTYTATNRNIHYKPASTHTLKSRAEPALLYSPEGFSDSIKSGNDNSSVGRRNELAALMDAFNSGIAGISNTAILEGDSGMGKSKLLVDFKNGIKSKEIKILSGSGDFLARNTPYSAWADIFSSILNLTQTDLLNTKTSVIESLVNRYGYRACLLNAVLQLDIPDSKEVKTMTGSQRVVATHDFLLALLKEETEKQALIIIIDDAQWMDEITWKLLDSINTALNNCFIVLAFQNTEGIPQIQLLKNKGAKTILLKELLKEDEEALICARLGVTGIADDVYKTVHGIAKGNPFFCIELTDSLLELELLSIENNYCSFSKNILAEEISLPETVRGALRRKIDHLKPGSQLSMKVGSVVGNRFSSKIICGIYPIATEKKSVPSFLSEVMQSGFINETLVDNLEGYFFNNAITAEVAYEMTLSEQRKHLHSKTAEWYEKNFADNLSPFYVQVAHHWVNAGENEKAAGYFEKEAIRLFSLGFVKQALNIGLEGVKLLGYDIERDQASIMQKINRHMNVISALMTNHKIEDLINHKKLKNAKVETVIKLLLELSPFAHQCQQAELFALMSVTCLLLTLENGNGEVAAEVYSMYSIIYKALTGDSETAFAWSNLALAVDKKNGYTLRARVSFIHCWFIALWMQPLKKLIPIAYQAADAGFESGDILFACFDLSLVVVLKSTAGYHLDDVIAAAAEHYKKNNRMVVNAEFHLKHEEQVAKAFKGNTVSYTSLTDEKYDEAKDIANICETDLFNQVAYYLVSKLKLNVHFGNWKEAISWGEKSLPLLPAFINQPGYIELEQYYAMAALYHAMEKGKEDALNLMNTADAGIEKITGWAKLCPGNFLHKALLLEAIREGIKGEFAEAEKKFIQAAENADKAGFVQDAGLAWEHLLRLQHRLGLDYKNPLQCAINAYKKWGADAKIKYLQEEF